MKVNPTRIFLFLAFLPALVHASPVLWTLSNVNFEYGAVATGSFIYDADLGLYSAIDITTTNDSIRPGAHYTQFLATYFSNIGRPTQFGYFLTDAVGNLTNTPELTLEFYTPFTDSGGATSLLGSSELSCFNVDCSVGTSPLRSLNGTVIGVPVITPEPASALLVGGFAGVLLLIGLRTNFAARS